MPQNSEKQIEDFVSLHRRLNCALGIKYQPSWRIHCALTCFLYFFALSILSEIVFLTERWLCLQIKTPFGHQSDSFYFVGDRMIMHNKASYQYEP